MADNVEVRIVGDASGVQPAVEQASASVGGLKATIADISAFLASARAKFVEFGAAGQAAGSAIASGMEKAAAATQMESNAVTRMVMKVHEGAESIRTFQMRAKEFAEIYVAIFAVEAVAHWAEALGAAAEKTKHLSVITGATVAQVQALSGVAKMSGTSIDAITNAMTILGTKALHVTGNVSSTAKAFNAMGISAKDGHTSLERMLLISDKFQKMADGPTKAALAVQLFGRSGKDMIPLLNQGSAAIQNLMDKQKELGLVNEAAVKEGERLSSSVNEASVAWDGLKNTLTQAFGPILTKLVDGFIALEKAMIASYNSGGAVRVIFDGIGQVVEGVIEIVHAVGLAFSTMFNSTGDSAQDWKAAIKEVVESTVETLKFIIDALVLVESAFVFWYKECAGAVANFKANWIEQTGQIKLIGLALGEFMKVVGKVIEDALTLHWGSIAADWDAGMAHVHQVVKQQTDAILQTTAHLRKQATDDFAAAMNAGAAYDAFHKKLWQPYGGPQHDDTKFNFGGGTGNAPDISQGKGGKNKKPKDDLVQRLEHDLELQKVAWEKENILHDTARQFDLQIEADFWNAALKRNNLSAKDRYEISKKWIAAEQGLQKERVSAVLDADKKELFEADKNAKLKLAVLEKEAAFIHKMQVVENAATRAADMAVLQAKREVAQQEIELILIVAKASHDAAAGRVEDALSQAQFAEQMGAISKGKMIEAERQFQEKMYQIDRQEMLKRQSLIDPLHDKVGFAKISAEIEALNQKHQQKMTAIDRQAILQRTAIARQAINQVSAAFGQGIGQMLTGQITFRDGLIQMWQGLVQSIGQAISSIVEQWIAGEITKLIFGKATAHAGVSSQVALAGAGGVASMAAAPFPINTTAPAFGAAMSALAGSYMGLIHAEGGDYNVREGLYHLHENEMVLPAWAANPLRSMIQSPQGASFGGRGDPTKAGNSGDAHYHYSPSISHHDTSWDQLAKRDGREARRWFMSQWRAGRMMPAER